MRPRRANTFSTRRWSLRRSARVCVPESSSCATTALRNSNGANKRWNLWSSALAAGSRNARMKRFVSRTYFRAGSVLTEPSYLTV